MPLETVKWYTRTLLEKNRNKLFVFGDNLLREGFGGQAAACRGEPNAFGIPTKHEPSNAPHAFFTDGDFILVAPIIESSFHYLTSVIDHGGTVVWPEDGIGTGLADLPRKAPKIHALIEAQLEQLKQHAGVLQGA